MGRLRGRRRRGPLSNLWVRTRTACHMCGGAAMPRAAPHRGAPTTPPLLHLRVQGQLQTLFGRLRQVRAAHAPRTMCPAATALAALSSK